MSVWLSLSFLCPINFVPLVVDVAALMVVASSTVLEQPILSVWLIRWYEFIA
jgi:hypothetical protein